MRAVSSLNPVTGSPRAASPEPGRSLSAAQVVTAMAMAMAMAMRRYAFIGHLLVSLVAAVQN
jgi:hypothetical protein